MLGRDGVGSYGEPILSWTLWPRLRVSSTSTSEIVQQQPAIHVLVHQKQCEALGRP